MLQRHVARLGSAILLSGLFSCAHAVELGDALVRSHIGQPLSADIELTGLASETAPVQAALAAPDVYRGASIAMHPALAALNITIVRRDGRRFMHIASGRTVDSDHVPAFFELTENGIRTVRQVTLWFTPDPNPAPAAPPPPPPAKAIAPPAPLPVPVAAPVQAPVIAAALVAPPAARKAAPVPPAQPFTAAQIRTAAMLDAKNAALSGRIVELEEKVRTLTAAMQPSVAPAPAPKPHPLAKPLPAKMTPMGEPAGKPAAPMPWLFFAIVGATMLALAGALFVMRRRSRKVKAREQQTAARMAMPRFIASVRDRLMPGRKEAEPEVEVEAEAVPG